MKALIRTVYDESKSIRDIFRSLVSALAAGSLTMSGYRTFRTGNSGELHDGRITVS